MQPRKYFNCFMLASLAVLAFLSSPTTACFCREPTLRNIKYADYFIRAKVELENGPIYHVDILQKYKVTELGEQLLAYNTLEKTPDVSCSVQLVEGETYFIAGQGEYLNICNYIKTAADLTEDELLYISNL